MRKDPEIVAVDPNGWPRGAVGRHQAHQAGGVLHLAVSVQLVDSQGRWLLQRRAESKPVFAGRWSNSCCTHPVPGESLQAAALRGLQDELGLCDVELQAAGAFTYRARDASSGMVEHERDFVFVGLADTREVSPHPDHVSELALLPFRDALRTSSSSAGAPWAPEVLRRSQTRLRAGPLTDDRSPPFGGHNPGRG
jgi:isopentenyl-diphosphate delta-isomerase